MMKAILLAVVLAAGISTGYAGETYRASSGTSITAGLAKQQPAGLTVYEANLGKATVRFFHLSDGRPSRMVAQNAEGELVDFDLSRTQAALAFESTKTGGEGWQLVEIVVTSNGSIMWAVYYNDVFQGFLTMQPNGTLTFQAATLKEQ